MKNQNEISSRPGGSKKVYKTRQKIVNFLFFLLLSTVFWLLKVLDNNYTTNITVPIEYVPYRSDVEMVGNIPTTLSLNVSGQGYELLKRIISVKRKPIVLQVLALNLNPVKDSSDKYFVLTHYLKENIQRQLGSELTLQYIMPDTLWYTFSAVVKKKVKVVPLLEIKFIKQYMLEGDYIIQPDSIIVKGPKLIIDTLSAVYTEKETFVGVFRSFSRQFELQPINGISFETNKVWVTIPVDKFTQASIKVPIKTVNVPDSLNLILFPSFITIDYLVSLKNYDKINRSQFLVSANYEDCFTDISKINVSIEEYPYIIKLINYYPKSVEFIIEKKVVKSESTNKTKE
jgi:hypothetical protein